MTRRHTPLERYFRVIEGVSLFPNGATLAQLTCVLAMPKTTCHRLLHKLASVGVIKAGEGHGGTYGIGPRLLDLLQASRPDEWIAARARALLRELSAEFGETCFLARRRGGEIVSIAMVTPESDVRGYVVPGSKLWPHAAASAKAILAYLPMETVKAILPSPLPRLALHTKTRVSDLQRELAEVRRSGFAYCRGEDVDGFAGIACPVDIPGRPASLSLCITGTIDSLGRHDQARLAQRLRLVAERLATVLRVGAA